MTCNKVAIGKDYSNKDKDYIELWDPGFAGNEPVSKTDNTLLGDFYLLWIKFPFMTIIINHQSTRLLCLANTLS